MRIGLIIPGNVWFCPFVTPYTKLLENENISYDIISWDRCGTAENAIQFKLTTDTRNPFRLLLGYMRYTAFVKQEIKKNNYNKLIIFGSQIGIFLTHFLANEYKGKYIFDFRDLSIEQKFYMRRAFVKLLRNSYANIISSPNFTKYLPTKFEYIISHNFDAHSAEESLNNNYSENVQSEKIDVLTIGGIRDFESNVEVLRELSNKNEISLRFVGRGPAAAQLKKESEKLGSQNVEFVGYYDKKNESSYISKASFINIFYPRKPSHDSAISNRFYLSLIHKKPMITTQNTTQGDLCEKYNIGLAIKTCEGLSEKLIEYLKSLDKKSYEQRCSELLLGFIEDYKKWKLTFLHFIEH